MSVPIYISWYISRNEKRESNLEGLGFINVPMRQFNFSLFLILPAIQPLTEMSTRNVPGDKGRPIGA
jgi:hypothetical protein